MRARGSVLVGACTLAAALLTPAGASAADSWTCRGSALQAQLSSNEVAEPTVANRPNDPCATEVAGMSDAGVPTNDGAAARTRGGYAKTELREASTIPGLGNEARTRAPVAEAGADQAGVLKAGDTYAVAVEGATSIASAQCVGGTPLFAGTGKAAKLTLGGQPIDLDQPLQQLTDQLNASPLGALVKVEVNTQGFEGNQFRRTALRVRVAPSATGAAADVTIGESRVGFVGNPCSTTAPPGVQCPEGFEYAANEGACVKLIQVPGTGDPRQPCPEGSALSVQGVCFRSEFTAVLGQSSGVTVFPVGGPSGSGTNTGFGSIPRGRLGPCANRSAFPAQAVFVGTDGNDRITGTRDSDIVLGAGGKDNINGGGANDCLRGEAGDDLISGGQGNDTATGDKGRNKLYGGAGNDNLRGEKERDFLSGEAGNDTLRDMGGNRNFLLTGAGNNTVRAGSGRDFITAGSGRDTVIAGAGNDQINAAKQGRATKIRCGAGRRDLVRVNPNEMRSLRGCERKFVVRRA